MSVKASDFVSSHAKEGVKQHIVYDGSNRMTHVYVALATAEDGDRCMLTRYQYSGVTTLITGSVEEVSTWQGAWDF
jgi:hypothetical protein